jgi:NACHT C-terminal Alpha/Beta 2
MYGLPASDLRKDLFAMVVAGTPSESAIATECLAAIDGIRDDYGEAEFERRHPDITRNVPWPRVGGNA